MVHICLTTLEAEESKGALFSLALIGLVWCPERFGKLAKSTGEIGRCQGGLITSDSYVAVRAYLSCRMRLHFVLLFWLSSHCVYTHVV